MNILVVYGGKSCEHDISVITGCLSKGLFDGNVTSGYFDKNNSCWLVPNNLTPAQHLTYVGKTAICFASGKGGVYLIRNKRARFVDIDVVVNCCHGVNGEDGCVAALCQMASIPCVGSPLAASAIAMDKWLTKCMLQQCNYPTLPAVCLKVGQDNEIYLSQTKPLGYPVIVKPCVLGSSIGVVVCHNQVQLLDAVGKAFSYCSTVLVEQALTNFVEYNCAAMKDGGIVVASQVSCPLSLSELLTFEEKYISAPTLVPQDIPQQIQQDVESLTKQIYQDFCFEGVIRVDYLMDKSTNALYVNEINTIPGSLAYGLWQDKYTPLQYGNALVAQAVADYRTKCSYTYTFPSVVLSGGHGKKK